MTGDRLIEVGDIAYVGCRLCAQGKGSARVIAIAEGFAMLRPGRGMPYVAAVRELKRVEQPVGAS